MMAFGVIFSENGGNPSEIWRRQCGVVVWLDVASLEAPKYAETFTAATRQK
jgi:hypothetical protein